ncbi:GntR family transcriptional regulator YhfZ [Xenorhabdus szentirmaii]|uniref:GntR family transcriptional regulator YhfZ n=1 Tax=Xenorhabdus szentirmaii TaxID=290112 RepID=UPI001FCAA4AB|nr:MULTISPECIES: GntR family transcriptional regulator YhfZ [Xenorhabdus]
MSQTFIKKEGIAQAFLARYLLSEQCGNRLKTIELLAKECELSVGLMQAALKSLEQAQAIGIKRRGRNGSYLSQINHKLLLEYANIGNVVCAMPLPYTRTYEGLASGLKALCAGVPFYFAHMRGSDIRIECLLNGIYDLAVTSRLAAEQHPEHKDLYIALSLGTRSYTDRHRLIFRQGEKETIRRVGLDSASADQKIMTSQYFAGKEIELVEISYHECLNQIIKGHIDATIWNVGQGHELLAQGLTTELPEDSECFTKASEAVILTRKDNIPIQQFLRTIVDRDALLAHQKNVIAGIAEPAY